MRLYFFKQIKIDIRSQDKTYTNWYERGEQREAAHFTEDKCPPQPKFGTKRKSKRFDSSCASDGIDNSNNICADNPCSGSSDCFPISETKYHCVCHPGYRKNEDSQCEKIVKVNECETGTGCSVNADCKLHPRHMHIDAPYSQGSTDYKNIFHKFIVTS